MPCWLKYKLLLTTFEGDSAIFSRVHGASQVTQMVRNLPANAGDTGWIPESGRSLKEAMTTHSSILAWESPWTEGPGGLQSMRVQKSQVRLSDRACI